MASCVKIDRRAHLVNSRAYALNGGIDLDEAYVLAHEGGQWSVYYSERGIPSGLRIFATEEAACADLLHRVISDRQPVSTRAPMRRAPMRATSPGASSGCKGLRYCRMGKHSTTSGTNYVG